MKRTRFPKQKQKKQTEQRQSTKTKNALEIEIDVSRNVFNDVYFQYLEDPTPTQIFFGGASAGKSVFVVGQRAVLDLLKGGRNYLILRNVARTSRHSTFNEFTKVIRSWGLESYFKIKETEMEVTCINGYQAIFSGLDDVDKLKSITPKKGVITDIIVEEATETQRADVKQLQKRLRGKTQISKRLHLLFNPILKSHWIWKEYFQDRFNDSDTVYRDPFLLIQKATYKDNKFLSEQDKQALENESDEYFYNVYTLGNWGVLGGLIFNNWRVEDLISLIPTFDNIRNGLDFGFSNHPTAYNRIHYDPKRKRIYIFQEEHMYSKTNPEIATVLQPVIGNERIVCDSAEPKSIEELCRAGLDAVGAAKGKDSVKFGIQWLRQHEIIIHKQCQETINEFEQYQWKKNRLGETLDQPVDKNNHHIDAIRYALEDDMLESDEDLIRFI